MGDQHEQTRIPTTPAPRHGTEPPGEFHPPAAQPGPPAAVAQPVAEPFVDRWAAAWRAKWWIAATVIGVTGLTAGVATVLPATYESAAQVRVTVFAAAGQSARDSVDAANDVANQYAQTAVSVPVIGPAAQATGIGTDDLTGRVTAATVGSQNVVQLTVQAGTPDAARTEADAVAAALVAYIQARSADQLRAFQDSLATQLKPFEQQIADAQTAVTVAEQAAAEAAIPGTGPATIALNAAQTRLTTLLDRRATVTSQAATQAAALSPQAAAVGEASTAVKVFPKPTLYSALAALLALLVALQVTMSLATRRVALEALGRPAQAARTVTASRETAIAVPAVPVGAAVAVPAGRAPAARETTPAVPAGGGWDHRLLARPAAPGPGAPAR